MALLVAQWIASFIIYCLVMTACVFAISLVLLDGVPAQPEHSAAHWIKLNLACLTFLCGPHLLSSMIAPIEPLLLQMITDCLASVPVENIQPHSYGRNCIEGCSITAWVCLAVL